LLKATDKLTDELTYFYNPASFAGLASTIFPAMGLITNFSKLLKNFGIEMFALAQGDEKKQKETFVLKYLMKTFPVSNQMAAYLPMFYPALAKDLGLKVQSNYGIR
jgi:ribosomal protein S8